MDNQNTDAIEKKSAAFCWQQWWDGELNFPTFYYLHIEKVPYVINQFSARLEIMFIETT